MCGFLSFLRWSSALILLLISNTSFSAEGDVIYSSNAKLACQVGDNVQSLADVVNCVTPIVKSGDYTYTYMYATASGTNTIYTRYNLHKSSNNSNSTISSYFRINMGSSCAFIDGALVCGLPCNSNQGCLVFYAESCSAPSYISGWNYTSPKILSFACITPAPIECQFGSDCEDIIEDHVDAPIVYIGVQGLTGEQGIQGEQGDQGQQGIQGETGEQGTQGIAGLNGADGVNGEQGIQGELGEQGVQGIAGLNGLDGLDGLNGINGAQGIQGIQGLTGLSGQDAVECTVDKSGAVTTISCPSGYSQISEILIKEDVHALLKSQFCFVSSVDENTNTTTYDCPEGQRVVQVNNGVDGQDFEFSDFTPEQLASLKGADGVAGVDGSNGVNGTNGIDGANGVKGDTGTAGQDGDDGLQGADGLQGVQGQQGIKGQQGIQGVAGVDGTDGEVVNMDELITYLDGTTVDTGEWDTKAEGKFDQFSEDGIPHDEFNVEAEATSYLSGNGVSITAACPAAESIDILGSNVEFSYGPLCDLADLLKPLLLAFTWISAMVLYFRSL